MYPLLKILVIKKKKMWDAHNYIFNRITLCPFFPLSPPLFRRVLRDSTSRLVGPSVDPSVRCSVGPSVTLYFFGVNGGFGLNAPARMFH